MTLVLGIETSCDETAAAVIEDGHAICSNVVASQVELHQSYGGIFPEMASRQHMTAILPVIEQAMDDAEIEWQQLDAIAVTNGPGLSGSLLVGVNAAKGLAFGHKLPLIGVNHIEAHIATNWLDVAAPRRRSRKPKFPLLCLVVSGGHTELILMHNYGKYERLGSTLDDAAGEAFDKAARMLNLGYPGGPAIQRAAENGDPAAFSFTRARPDGRYDFSFSGLKTALLRAVQQYDAHIERPADRLSEQATGQPPSALTPETAADLAASFQAAVVDMLVDKTCQAATDQQVKGVLLAGGVAANKALRERLAASLDIPLRMPPISLATDNATGVGVAGSWSLKRGHTSGWDLDVIPRLELGVTRTTD